MNPPSPSTSAGLPISRRAALETLGAGALLSLGLWPGALRAATATPPPESFTFAVINDTHYLTPECGVWLEGVVNRIKAESPDFCLHLGDLVDTGRREHLAAVRDIFAGLGKPVYVQIGNHDHLTQTDGSAYEALFPDRLNYRFTHRGWQFVGLDSSDGVRFENTRIGDATLKWVDAQLPALDRTQPLVLFTHFPLGEGVKHRPLNADALLDRFRDCNLQAVFNGHFHGYTAHPFHQAVVTTNRCCSLKRNNHDGTREKGFFICTARDGRITRRFVEVPVPAPAA
ncbi:MAG: metallophosphoesterase [Verrucomicrobia bacterium]|nr:metallophosphoesterase [Verrucomicrobiota bacterium]